eukprot:4799740-Ditylum_brightwellii.AAC.1
MIDQCNSNGHIVSTNHVTMHPHYHLACHSQVAVVIVIANCSNKNRIFKIITRQATSFLQTQQSVAGAKCRVTRLRNVISCKSNNGQIHNNHTSHDNHQNPNFNPAFQQFEKG